MNSDSHYFRPRVDERTYENAVEKATFLTDNMYIRLTNGYTFETLVSDLIKQEIRKSKENT